MPRTTIVVPCYNEAARLDVAQFRKFSSVDYIFVDDGSTDGTAEVLAGFSVLRNERNLGKAESVRRGLLKALESGAEYVGYWDADLATPLEEIEPLIAELENDAQLAAILGSRILFLGRNIERRAVRHYGGRVIATFISIILGMPVYDTQCGAKMFRVTPALRDALQTPFASSWLFDAELIGRLHIAGQVIHELPLRRWHDVPGSKVSVTDILRVPVNLIALRNSLARTKSNSR